MGTDQKQDKDFVFYSDPRILSTFALVPLMLKMTIQTFQSLANLKY